MLNKGHLHTNFRSFPAFNDRSCFKKITLKSLESMQWWQLILNAKTISKSQTFEKDTMMH